MIKISTKIRALYESKVVFAAVTFLGTCFGLPVLATLVIVLLALKSCDQLKSCDGAGLTIYIIWTLGFWSAFVLGFILAVISLALPRRNNST